MILKDIAKQLANRVNQEHYVLHYLNKVSNYFYKKGKEETEKQFVISGVGWRSKQLQSFVSGFYEWHKKQGYASVKREDWDDYIKTL